MAENPRQIALSASISRRRHRKWWTPAMTVQALLLTAVLAWQYQHVLNYLVSVWSTNGDWSHGFIIPVFSLYYLYLRRDRMPLDCADRNQAARVIGAILLVGAFLLHVYCTLAKIGYPTNAALVISILGAVMMTCGWAWTRWSWFAIAFLVFAIPIPQRLYVDLTMPLRFIAAQVSAAVLAFVPGMETEAQGAVVRYFYKGQSSVLDIEQACSGMRLLMTMMALGVAMAFVSERPLWHRLVMILACIPIAIFCNMVRVTSTGFMVVFGRADLAKGFWHMMLGLGMLAIAFTLYGGISYILNHLVVEPEGGEQEDEVSRATAGGSPE